ncbi:MAG TPA: T9SS type A sorting domain-containing protein, partial [Flavobacteriales bacterium]|nr:T9SS type A sorting domain-containing protein [Flavobacteriales bacterium]
SSVHITTTGLGGTNIRVRILDAIGRAIQVPDPRASVTGSTVDVSGLPPGAYLVNVAGDRATAVGRLLVARP